MSEVTAGNVVLGPNLGYETIAKKYGYKYVKSKWQRNIDERISGSYENPDRPTGEHSYYLATADIVSGGKYEQIKDDSVVWYSPVKQGMRFSIASDNRDCSPIMLKPFSINVPNLTIGISVVDNMDVEISIERIVSALKNCEADGSEFWQKFAPTIQLISDIQEMIESKRKQDTQGYVNDLSAEYDYLFLFGLLQQLAVDIDYVLRVYETGADAELRNKILRLDLGLPVD